MVLKIRNKFPPGSEEDAALRDFVGPLLCVDVESLEVWSSVFTEQTFAGVLEQWFLQDPDLMQPLSSFRYAGTLQRPPWFDREAHALAVRVARILIDPAQLVSDPNFSKNRIRPRSINGQSSRLGVT
jgi:hypothetical protein